MFLRHLRQAIEANQPGSIFMEQLIKEWQTVPILLFRNVGDEFTQALKQNSDMIEFLASERSRTWLLNNFDRIMNYLLMLSKRPSYE